jgi:hypothetical protein
MKRENDLIILGLMLPRVLWWQWYKFGENKSKPDQNQIRSFSTAANRNYIFSQASSSNRYTDSASAEKRNNNNILQHHDFSISDHVDPTLPATYQQWKTFLAITSLPVP